MYFIFGQKNVLFCPNCYPIQHFAVPLHGIIRLNAHKKNTKQAIACMKNHHNIDIKTSQ